MFERLIRRLVASLTFLIVIATAPGFFLEAKCRGARELRFEPRLTRIFDLRFIADDSDDLLAFAVDNGARTHADLAAVMSQASESAFDYFGPVFGFWRGLCRVKVASERFAVAPVGTRFTAYAIGDALTADMLLTGLYERTIGAATVAVRGATPTAEDILAMRVEADRAARFEEKPNGGADFPAELATLWKISPFGEVSRLRSTERRFALTLEFSGRAALSRFVPLPPRRTISQFVVDRFQDDDAAAAPRARKIRDFDDGSALIETDARDLVSALKVLAMRGRSFEEIGGRRRSLTTILARQGRSLSLPGTQVVAQRIQSDPELWRVTMDTPLADLAEQIRATETQGETFERVLSH